MTVTHRFAGVALLVTHYNRSKSLERLLTTFAAQGCVFDEIIVSDDGSKPEHQEYLKQLAPKLGFKLITTPVNRGLGNNINKGQDAVNAPYTLYVQEDFEPAADFPQHFADAMAILYERPEFDMARFYAYFKYPYLKPIRNGFSEMVFKLWYPGYKKFYFYSDHPHVRKSDFLQKFGRYPEGLKGDVTEYTMMMNVLKKKGKAIYYEDYQGLFFQKNSSDEPSTMKRETFRTTSNPVISFVRHIYRHLKFNKDYLKP